MSTMEKKGNIVDAFMQGAKNGMHIAINSTIPNILFAFAIIQVLELTGTLRLIGIVFQPVMGLFGLPGVAATALMGAMLSMGGGIGVIASLLTNGELVAQHAAILLPAIYLMGSQIQYIGRIGGTAGIPSKYTIHMIVISILNAAMAMLVMRFFV